MASRRNLHDELTVILGSKNVYYQPPASFKMNYPAIRYSLEQREAKKADNEVYMTYKKYSVTVITRDADSEIPDEILKHFPLCRFDRRYVADNLYHDVFTISY